MIGDRFGTISSTFNKAQVHVRLGEYDEAELAISAACRRVGASNFSRHLLFAVPIEADRLLNSGGSTTG